MKVKKIISLIESLDKNEMKQLLKEFIDNDYVNKDEEEISYRPYRDCDLISEIDYEEIMKFVEKKRKAGDKRTYGIGKITIQAQSYDTDFESNDEYEEYYEESGFFYKEFEVYYVADEDMFYVEFDDFLMQDFQNPDLIDLLNEVKKELDLYAETSEEDEGIKIENYEFKSYF